MVELTASQIEEFRRDGHILVRDLATPEELSRFRPAIRDACRRFATETRHLEERDTYGKAFLQVMNLWRLDEEVRRFVFARTFAEAAARLLGVRNVRLYHDQALFKEPLGGYTPWHQDQYYWPLDTDKTITMWMPLVDVDTKMGMLTFASGSHLKGPIGNIRISDESEEAYDKYVAANGFPIVRADVMRAGDATFHQGWTIHSAGANNSPDSMREVMTIIYFADGVRIAKPQNPNQEDDLRTWLGGREPGEFADSEFNPILT